MIAIIDYGVGNLFSLCPLLNLSGQRPLLPTTPTSLVRRTSCLCWVEAFGDAMEKLKKSGLDKTLLAAADRGTDIMGICLGMQLLFEKAMNTASMTGSDF